MKKIHTAKIVEGYIYNGGGSNLSNINVYSAALKHWNNENSYTSWLYGAIGIPFMFRVIENTNTPPVLYELPHSRMVNLLNNLGVRVEGISSIASGATLHTLREKAWDSARKAIDAGYTCFGRGFYFNDGETSVVQGYDENDSSYIISCWHDTKRVNKQSIGEDGGLIDLYWMMPDGVEEDDRRTVRDALRLAVEFAEGGLTGVQTMVADAAYDHWV